MVVVDENGQPYILIRQAREPCPFASRYEAAVEPERKMTAENCHIRFGVKLPQYLLHPPPVGRVVDRPWALGQALRGRCRLLAR